MNIEVIVTGDFCPGRESINLMNEGRCDLIYNNALEVLSGTDLSITNLECPLTDVLNPIEKTGPNLVSPESAIEIIKYGKFNLVTLANNHILDQGALGLKHTIEVCEKNGITTVGAGNSLDEARAIKYIQIRAIRIAVINFAEKEYSIATKNTAGANPFCLTENYYSIKEAKEKSDFVLVIAHAGVEHYNLPTPELKKAFRFFVDCGANAVIAHHTHCPSGYEVYNHAPIFYGIGNFIFDRKSKYLNWNLGYFVKLFVDEQTLEVKFEIYPYTQFKNKPGLCILSGIERSRFIEETEKLSEIISNDLDLINNWESFIAKQNINITAYFLPFFPFKRKLLSKKKLPKVIRQKLLGTMNTLQCKSLLAMYRDGLKNYLKNN